MLFMGKQGILKVRNLYILGGWKSKAPYGIIMLQISSTYYQNVLNAEKEAFIQYIHIV